MFKKGEVDHHLKIMEQQTNIVEQINILAGLQSLDTEIYHFKKEKESLPAEVNKLQNEFGQKAKSLSEYEDRLKTMQLKRKEKELDLENKEGGIKKYQVQLYQVKTNKEYSSLMQEIENLKADNSVLEEEILKILEETDTVRIELAQRKEGLVQEEKRLSVEKQKIEEQIRSIERKLEELNSQRGQVAAKLDTKIISRYERILKNKGGLALVSIENDACQGCHMSLPPQVINEIKMKDKIITCENCARILYSKE